MAKKSPRLEKFFQVKEFVFFEAVHDHYIALIGGRGGWDADVLIVAERFEEVTRELIAMVGVSDEVVQRDAIAMQMV